MGNFNPEEMTLWGSPVLLHTVLMGTVCDSLSKLPGISLFSQGFQGGDN